MKVALVVNNSLRHNYFANMLIQNFEVVGVIETIRDYYMEAKASGDRHSFGVRR